MSRKPGTGKQPQWTIDVLGWVWATVEFMRWRDSMPVTKICARLENGWLWFDVAKARAAHEPMFACHEENGETVIDYPEAETKKYSPGHCRAALDGSANIRAVYYRARGLIMDERYEFRDRLAGEANLKLQMLKDEFTGGFLAGMLPLEEYVPPPPDQSKKRL